MSHFLLAATSLVLWVIYVVTDSSALAWLSFILLLVVATLGFTMFAIRLRRRRATALETVTPDTPAEQHFPVSVVAHQGVLAATRLLLVLLTAVGPARSVAPLPYMHPPPRA